MTDRPSAKSTLFLVEIAAVILVFALSSAVFVQAFVGAHTVSAHNAALSGAVNAARSAAELYKACGVTQAAADKQGGSLDETGLTVWYDGDWQPCEAADAAFRLTLRPDGATCADVAVAEWDAAAQEAGETLFTLRPVRLITAGGAAQ